MTQTESNKKDLTTNKSYYELKQKEKKIETTKAKAL